MGIAFPTMAIELPGSLVQALASDDFKERESNQGRLLDWARLHGEAAVDAIWTNYRSCPDPEVRERCLAVLRELVADRYRSEGPGFLGIERSYGRVIPPGEKALQHAVLVTGVKVETPASRAGIQAGDMIVRLDGTGWTNEACSDEFAEQIASHKPGIIVKLGIVRGGNWLELNAVLMRRPSVVQILRFGIPGVDGAADERAEIDAYFKDWLAERISRK